MTTTGRSADEDLEAQKATLRSLGLRSTPARLAVMRELKLVSSPISHSELTERLKSLGFDKATIFRNLTELTELGVLSRTSLGDNVWHFELIKGPQHPHFVCIECGNVTCLENVELAPSSQKQALAIGCITEIVIRGHCRTCEPTHRKSGTCR